MGTLVMSPYTILADNCPNTAFHGDVEGIDTRIHTSTLTFLNFVMLNPHPPGKIVAFASHFAQSVCKVSMAPVGLSPVTFIYLHHPSQPLFRHVTG